MKGKFIVFEGITGSGKKTHIQLLKEKLEKVGKNIVVLSFPDYERDIARLTKRLDFNPYALSLLFAADRANWQEKIKEFLKEGKIVISDRYCYSNFAYQGAKGIELNWLMEIEKKIIKPDLVFLIDVPVEISMQRIQQASIKDFTKIEALNRLKKEKENIEKVREIYLNLAKSDKEAKWFVIDGTKSIKENHEKILSIVLKEIEK